jgi:hypothetical protein
MMLPTPGLATAVGAVAIAINTCWPLLRDRKRILCLQVLSATLFATHYALLGAATASAMCVAGIIQGTSAVFLRRRALRLGAFGATIAGGLSLTVATWSGLPSLLAQSAQVFSACGRLQRSPQALRWCFLASECFWTCHNVLVGSGAGLTSDALATSMLILGLWRNRTRRASRPAAEIVRSGGVAPA